MKLTHEIYAYISDDKNNARELVDTIPVRIDGNKLYDRDALVVGISEGVETDGAQIWHSVNDANRVVYLLRSLPDELQQESSHDVPTAELIENVPEFERPTLPDVPHVDIGDLLEMAWGIIANAHNGIWEDAPPDWKNAAQRWRDDYHRYLQNMIDDSQG